MRGRWQRQFGNWLAALTGAYFTFLFINPRIAQLAAKPNSGRNRTLEIDVHESFFRYHQNWEEYLFTKLLHPDQGPPFAYYDPKIERVHLLIFDRNENLHVSGNCRCYDRNYNLFSASAPKKNPAVFPSYRGDMVFNAHCDCGKKIDQRIGYVSIEWDEDSPDPDRGTSQYRPPLPNKVPVIPIQRKTREWDADTTINYEFAICLAPIFGPYPHWLLLLQFIETHRALGAARFFIYYLDAQDRATRALLYYYQIIDPLAELIPLKPVDSDCGEDHYCRHDYQIQDCVLRARAYGYKYVAPLDLDELIIPSTRESLSDLLRKITKKDGHTYTLRHEWVFRDRPDPSFVHGMGSLDSAEFGPFLEKYLPINRFHTTTQIGTTQDTQKAIVDTEHSLYMGVHSIVAAAPNTKGYMVEPSSALIRHYRNISDWSGYAQKVKDYSPLIQTNIRPDLKAQILKSSNAILKKIAALMSV